MIVTMAPMPTNRLLRRAAGSLLAIAILTATACTEEAGGGGPQTSETPETPDDEPQEAGPESLLYLDGRKLMRFEVESGEHERLARLPSADVSVSPDATRFVVVEETAANPNPDEYVKPRLRIGDVDGSGKTTDLGPGYGPQWSPDSTRVAAVVGDIGFICGSEARIRRGEEAPEGCVPAEQVVSFPATEEAGDATIVLGPTKGWSLLGFTAGDRVAGISHRRAVVIGAPEGKGDPTPLGFEPQEVWDVSPTEPVLLMVQKRRTLFAAPGEGSAPPLKLKGSSLGDGSWSPDGARVAVVLLRPGSGDRLGVIDVNANEVEVVPDSQGAQGNVVWGPEGSFAYVRTDPGQPAKLQAVLCSEDLSCEQAFSWRSRVALLAAEDQSRD